MHNEAISVVLCEPLLFYWAQHGKLDERLNETYRAATTPNHPLHLQAARTIFDCLEAFEKPQYSFYMNRRENEQAKAIAQTWTELHPLACTVAVTMTTVELDLTGTAR